MVEKLPSDLLQAKMRKYEELRMNLARILQSMAEAQRELEEAKLVVKELEKIPDDTELYKQVGFVLIPIKKEGLIKDLEDRIVNLEAKLGRLKKMKEDIEAELSRLAEEIKKIASGKGGVALGG